MTIDKEQHVSNLKSKFKCYAPIPEESWSLIVSIIKFQELEKDEILLRNGQIAKNVYFVCQGALRAYVTDYNRNIYNKNIFLRN